MITHTAPPIARRTPWLVVPAAWCVLCLPLFVQAVVNDGADAASWRDQLWPWATWFLATPPIVWLAFRLPVSARTPRHLAVHVVACLGLVAVGQSAAAAGAPGSGRRPGPPPWVQGLHRETRPLAGRPPAARATVDAAFYILLSGICHALVAARRSRDREERLLRAEAEVARAKLGALQLQLRPHFLFNALHGLSSLIPSDPARAVTLLDDLSDLLRAALETATEPQLPLAREAELLQRYLAIQQVRFGARLTVTMDIPPETHAALVPTFILQPIVENAVHHGVERIPGACAITVRAGRRNGNVVVTVHNAPAADSEPPRSDRGGIGLANSRERLAQLYGDAGQLVVTSIPDGTVATLTLPWKTT